MGAAEEMTHMLNWSTVEAEIAEIAKLAGYPVSLWLSVLRERLRKIAEGDNVLEFKETTNATNHQDD